MSLFSSAVGTLTYVGSYFTSTLSNPKEDEVLSKVDRDWTDIDLSLNLMGMEKLNSKIELLIGLVKNLIVTDEVLVDFLLKVNVSPDGSMWSQVLAGINDLSEFRKSEFNLIYKLKHKFLIKDKCRFIFEGFLGDWALKTFAVQDNIRAYKAHEPDVNKHPEIEKNGKNYLNNQRVQLVANLIKNNKIIPTEKMAKFLIKMEIYENNTIWKDVLGEFENRAMPLDQCRPGFDDQAKSVKSNILTKFFKEVPIQERIISQCLNKFHISSNSIRHGDELDAVTEQLKELKVLLQKRREADNFKARPSDGVKKLLADSAVLLDKILNEKYPSINSIYKFQNILASLILNPEVPSSKIMNLMAKRGLNTDVLQYPENLGNLIEACIEKAQRVKLEVIQRNYITELLKHVTNLSTKPVPFAILDQHNIVLAENGPQINLLYLYNEFIGDLQRELIQFEQNYPNGYSYFINPRCNVDEYRSGQFLGRNQKIFDQVHSLALNELLENKRLKNLNYIEYKAYPRYPFYHINSVETRSDCQIHLEEVYGPEGAASRANHFCLQMKPHLPRSPNDVQSDAYLKLLLKYSGLRQEDEKKILKNVAKGFTETGVPDFSCSYKIEKEQWEEEIISIWTRHCWRSHSGLDLLKELKVQFQERQNPRFTSPEEEQILREGAYYLKSYATKEFPHKHRRHFKNYLETCVSLLLNPKVSFARLKELFKSKGLDLDSLVGIILDDKMLTRMDQEQHAILAEKKQCKEIAAANERKALANKLF